ncbi:MAG: ribosomal protein S18-alanine N-acetyltransferase [Thermodesulfobacteriota bacterium]|nr:ribosomal protein S18-alanine N-acetyltransferase [Thermodesulfobacteriota bacterium]
MNIHLAGKPLSISGFTTSDIENIVALEEACFQNPWHKVSFENELHIPDAGGFVAKIGDCGKVSGYILFRTILDEMHILKLATDPVWRNQNIASLLIQKAVATARASQCDRVFLEVRTSNKAAIGVYKKNGFTVNDIRKGYYAPDDDALMMEMQTQSLQGGIS